MATKKAKKPKPRLWLNRLSSVEPNLLHWHFVPTNRREVAIRKCPWARALLKDEGGYWCFDIEHVDTSPSAKIVYLSEYRARIHGD